MFHPASLAMHRGFSLVESLVTLLIAGVLLVVAVPSMVRMVQAQRCASLVHAFVYSLHTTRSEAIKRNARVAICKSSDGVTCVRSGGWDQGWIVFQDANNNARHDAEEEVIAQRHGASDLRFTGNGNVDSYVSYGPTGRAELTSGAIQAGTFTLCAPAHWGMDTRRILLARTGSYRVTKEPVGKGGCV